MTDIKNLDVVVEENQKVLEQHQHNNKLLYHRLVEIIIKLQEVVGNLYMVVQTLLLQIIIH